MTDVNGIPHLLNSYLRLPPEGSLTVLTSVLNATTNWLVLRYLLVASRKVHSVGLGKPIAPKVIFVSFLRDWDFWRDGARRLGLDLSQAVEGGRIIYIDGLTNLFTGNAKSVSSASTTGSRRSIVDGRLASVTAMISDILASIYTTNETQPLCIIDGLDFLLASTQVSSAEILSTIMTWRDSSYAMILAISGDQPLIHTQQTPLDIEHVALVTGLVHQAYLVMSLRLLSTGVARDVSGVLRLSRGGSITDIDESQINEKEVLYLVGGDGSVKVFERGA